MKKLLFLTAILFGSISSFVAQGKHIENPSFGPTSTYRFVEDPADLTVLKERQDKDMSVAKENPFTSIRNNSVVFTRSSIESTNSSSLSQFLTTQGFDIFSDGGEGSTCHLTYHGFSTHDIKVYVDDVLMNTDTVNGEFDWSSLDINSVDFIEIEESPKLSDIEFAGCVVRIYTRNSGKYINAELSNLSYESSFSDTWRGSVQAADCIGALQFNLGVSYTSAGNEYATLEGKHLDQGIQHLSSNFGWKSALNEYIKVYGSHTLNNNKVWCPSDGYYNLNPYDVKYFSTTHSVGLYSTGKVDNTLSLTFGESTYDYSDTSLGFYQVRLTDNCSSLLDLSTSLVFEGDKENEGSFRCQGWLGLGKTFGIGSVELTPSVKAGVWGGKSKGYKVLPQLDIVYSGLVFSAYRLFCLPTIDKVNGPWGNKELIPEEGWAASLSYRDEKFPLWFRAQGSYFQNKVCYDLTAWKYYNAGESFQCSITLGTDLALFTDSLLLSVSGTYNKAVVLGSWESVPRIPSWQAHTSITYYNQGFSLSVTYNYFGERIDLDGGILQGVHLLEAQVCYKVKAWQIYLKGNNLLDVQHEYVAGVYLPSRSWTLGLKFNL